MKNKKFSELPAYIPARVGEGLRVYMLNEQEIDNENHRVMRTELYINVEIGATVSTSPYEDVDTEYTPLPLLYLQAWINNQSAFSVHCIWF
ncbi:hypothetical protein OLMES_1742 [Oleiphilus messinensis]|uniref:Uncharacterized protein n=1 Tax=Oleiphilus messinensis TaxID=141451 RepID=A0A1Y0I5R6_9GAMM|nr:hypothetical protein [Oleiphilus messinensis]ARU55817.1 hypothetical protein OLMES_1742 [Oleiphilus messinensis]